jgi:hypothetical protein
MEGNSTASVFWKKCHIAGEHVSHSFAFEVTYKNGKFSWNRCQFEENLGCLDISWELYCSFIDENYR